MSPLEQNLNRRNNMRGYILDLAISVEELVEKLGGTGRGLHEKTKSIAYLLEPKYERAISHKAIPTALATNNPSCVVVDSQTLPMLP